MVKQLAKIVFLCLLVVGGSVGLYFYERNRSSEAHLREEIRKLEQQKEHLAQFVKRLTRDTRVAEILVTDQVKKGDRIESTTLMFVEYGRDGKPLPPKYMTIRGNVAHLDAMVIKFDRGFIENDDPMRGHSLVLFYRIYGDFQTPADGFRIDEPGQAPLIYRGEASDPPEMQQFEAELWRNFWRLADDEKYRQEKGVRVAQGESPWCPFSPDKLYTVTLESSGGLSLTAKPIDGIWKEFRAALKRSGIAKSE
jgi:hypothetical protein